jgi:hypothetical protein
VAVDVGREDQEVGNAVTVDVTFDGKDVAAGGSNTAADSPPRQSKSALLILMVVQAPPPRHEWSPFARRYALRVGLV